MSASEKPCKHYTRKVVSTPNAIRVCNHSYAGWADSAEKYLFFCSRCKHHKVACNSNIYMKNTLHERENTLEGQREHLSRVDGLSLIEFDRRLEKWVHWHTLTLMSATVDALRLTESLLRARDYVLYIRLEARPQAEHNGTTATFFRVLDAEVVRWEDGIRRPTSWPGALVWLRRMQEESMRAGRGMDAAALVECPPLDVQTMISRDYSTCCAILHDLVVSKPFEPEPHSTVSIDSQGLMCGRWR
ncbi:hypothetical protein GY45DRAFT_1362774 [Cubamyces sp. BRFM 1775]|nr:hypothetical protein GY45DRAFT_1362774 [Cubamyces sp. BRFM 1775]